MRKLRWTVLAVCLASAAHAGTVTFENQDNGTFVVRNQLGQIQGKLVPKPDSETGGKAYRFQNDKGQLSDWQVRTKGNGDVEFVPSPFEAHRR